MRPDPPVTPTGRCPVCGNPRGRGIPKTLGKQARTRLAAMLAADPFDTSNCARSWHGCALPPSPPGQPSGERKRLVAA